MEVSGLIKTISQALPLGLESAQLYINSHRNFETYLSNSKSLLKKKYQIQTKHVLQKSVILDQIWLFSPALYGVC